MNPLLFILGKLRPGQPSLGSLPAPIPGVDPQIPAVIVPVIFKLDKVIQQPGRAFPLLIQTPAADPLIPTPLTPIIFRLGKLRPGIKGGAYPVIQSPDVFGADAGLMNPIFFPLGLYKIGKPGRSFAPITGDLTPTPDPAIAGLMNPVFFPLALSRLKPGRNFMPILGNLLVPHTGVQSTQQGVEAWISSDSQSFVQLTQIGIEAWVRTNTGEIAQWNPVFPDKPGNNPGGSGPPGHGGGKGGGGGSPGTDNSWVGWGRFDVVTEFDSRDFAYPTYLQASSGPTFYQLPTYQALAASGLITITGRAAVTARFNAAASGFLKATGQLDYSLRLSVSASGRLMSTAKAGIGLRAPIAAYSRLSMTGKLSPTWVLSLAGYSRLAMLSRAGLTGLFPFMQGRSLFVLTGRAGLISSARFSARGKLMMTGQLVLTVRGGNVLECDPSVIARLDPCLNYLASPRLDSPYITGFVNKDLSYVVKLKS